MSEFCCDPSSKLSSLDGVPRGICECRRHLTSLTFRWSAKTKAEGRLSKHLKVTWVWGRLPEQEEEISGKNLSEIGKRNDWKETMCRFLKLDLAKNSWWRDLGKKELCLEF